MSHINKRAKHNGGKKSAYRFHIALTTGNKILKIHNVGAQFLQGDSLMLLLVLLSLTSLFSLKEAQSISEVI